MPFSSIRRSQVCRSLMLVAHLVAFNSKRRHAKLLATRRTGFSLSGSPALAMNQHEHVSSGGCIHVMFSQSLSSSVPGASTKGSNSSSAALPSTSYPISAATVLYASSSSPGNNWSCGASARCAVFWSVLRLPFAVLCRFHVVYRVETFIRSQFSVYHEEVVPPIIDAALSFI